MRCWYGIQTPSYERVKPLDTIYDDIQNAVEVTDNNDL